MTGLDGRPVTGYVVSETVGQNGEIHFRSIPVFGNHPQPDPYVWHKTSDFDPPTRWPWEHEG